MILYDVYEYNGFGITSFIETIAIDELSSIQEAKENIDYQCELYSDLNSHRLTSDTGFFYFSNPRIIKEENLNIHEIINDNIMDLLL